MRMFRLSSWISESRPGEDVAHGVVPDAMAEARSPRPFPIQLAGTAKRKRDERDDEREPSAPLQEALPANKRQKADVIPPVSNRETTAQGQEKAARSNSADTGINGQIHLSPGQLRDVIESQMSLEILLKHNELRLINQELAKCQIALEQLRRCHLIPFPVAQETPGAMENVSNGTGPAIAPRQGENKAQWAPPYGVSDGPYTRHYSRWLIPDPKFDGTMHEWERGFDRSRAGKTMPEGRTTRQSYADGSTTGKVRGQRGSAGQKLQALPSGYSQSKENAGPSVLKRGDGQLVKLVCIDCQRENFGSTQGFINHCRIAHRREFKSHEEAAVQSGVPIELDEVGGIVGDDRGPPAATGLVHPLIRSAPTDRDAYATLLSRIHASLSLYHEGKLPGVTSIPCSPASTPFPQASNPAASQSPRDGFVPSADTPHLSDLMRSRGFNGNLGEIVGDIKKPVEIDDFSMHSEDSDTEKGSCPQIGFGLDGSSDSHSPAMRMPARATMSPTPFGRPGSSKGPESKNSRKPKSAATNASPHLPYGMPLNTTATISNDQSNTGVVNNAHTPDEDTDHDVAMLDGPIDLSPNTITSNNAPSLVSDDSEYDERNDDAESSLGESEGDDDGSDVAEIDFEDGDGIEKVLPRTALRAGTGSGLRKEEKHVTFVSPVKDSVKGRRRKK
jgi:ADA HAT complex component 1